MVIWWVVLSTVDTCAPRWPSTGTRCRRRPALRPSVVASCPDERLCRSRSVRAATMPPRMQKSARLKAAGYHATCIQSVTAPCATRSRRLPIAPPRTTPTAIRSPAVIVRVSHQATPAVPRTARAVTTNGCRSPRPKEAPGLLTRRSRTRPPMAAGPGPSDTYWDAHALLPRSAVRTLAAAHHAHHLAPVLVTGVAAG